MVPCSPPCSRWCETHYTWVMTVASVRKKEVQRRHFLDLLNRVATAACRSGNPSSSLDIVNVLNVNVLSQLGQWGGSQWMIGTRGWEKFNLPGTEDIFFQLEKVRFCGISVLEHGMIRHSETRKVRTVIQNCKLFLIFALYSWCRCFPLASVNHTNRHSENCIIAFTKSK